MSKQKTAPARYMVSVQDEPSIAGGLRFTFVPKRLHAALLPGELPKPAPEYVVSVHANGDGLAFRWSKAPKKDSTRAELEQLAEQRAIERAAWIQRAADLATQVENWAKELGWSTKRIDKKIEDSRLGNHKVAGLVMQDDAVRMILEPISATAPGSDGLVDLCLMPGYDDVASLCHREGGWQVHYVFPSPRAAAGIKEGESRPLSRKTLGLVLDEMKKHAE